MTGKSFSVRIKMMNEEQVECFLDPELKKHSRNIISKLTNFNINYLIRLQKDEFNKDYPEREDMPSTLTFEAFTRSQVKKKVRREKTFEEETKEFIGDQPIEARRRSRFSGSYNLSEIEKAALQVKVETPTVKRKRKLSNTSATSSSYHPELKIKIKGIGSNPQIKLEEVTKSTALQKQSEMIIAPFYYDMQPTPINYPAVMSTIPTTEQMTYIPEAESILAKEKSNKRLRVVLKQTEESSENDDVPVRTQRSAVRKKKKTPVKFMPSSSSSSDEAPVKLKTQNVPNSFGGRSVPKDKCLVDQVVKASESNLNEHAKSEHQNGFIEQETSNSEKKKSESKENMKNFTTELIEKNTEKKKFDMRAKPIEKKPIKEFKKPPIIEPPKVCFIFLYRIYVFTLFSFAQLNPKTDKPIKKLVSKPKPSGLEALGGIFTINNGWEDTEQKNKEEPNKYSNHFVIPKLTKRISSPSPLVENNQIASQKIPKRQSMISPPAQEDVVVKVIHRKVEKVPEENTPSKFNRDSNSSFESDDDILQASSKSTVSESEQEVNNDSDSSSVNENPKELKSASDDKKQINQTEQVADKNISKEGELDSSKIPCHYAGNESAPDSTSECPDNDNEDEGILSLCADEE